MMKAGKLFIVFFAVLGLMVGTMMVKAPMASAADLTGKWSFAVDSPAGKGNPTFVLKQDGNNVTGTYQGVFGDAPIIGTVDGDTFILNFESAGNKIVYNGKIDGNKVNGTLKMGTIGEGTFTGEKQ
jgi:hypothetical protein